MSYYKAIQILRDYLEEDNMYVNTIIHGKTDQKDIYKKNIFPLVHITPMGADISQKALTIYTFEIASLDIRDISTDVVEDKFIGNDNEIDDLSSTLIVLNKLVGKLRTRINRDGIVMSNVTNAIPIIYSNNNILDGWSITLELQEPTLLNYC